MTKELQAIQRQVIEKSVNLPRNTAFGQMQRVFDGISGIGTGLASKLASEQAGKEGAAAALAGEGAPRKLAPGVTKATRAYNEAFNNTQTSLNVLGGADQMNKKLLELSSSKRLNSNSIAEYNEVAKGIIKGTLDGTNPENRADVALGLTKHLFQTQNAMANKVQAFNDDELKAKFKSVVKTQSKDFKVSILSGDEDLIKFNEESLITTLKDQETLGQINKFELAEGLEAIKDTKSVYEIVREAREATASDTFDFWSFDFAKKDIPDDIKSAAWNIIAKERANIKAQISGGVEATTLASKLAIQQGNFTEEDLKGVQEVMPLIPGLKIANELQKSINKSITKTRDINHIKEALQNNDTGAIAVADSKDISAAYNDMVGIFTEQRKEETGDQNYQLSAQEKTFVAGQFPRGVEPFTKEAGTIMRAGSPEQAAEWAMALTFLESDRDKRAVLDGLSADENAIYLKLSSMLSSTDVDPTLAVERVRDEVLKKNDAEIQLARRRAGAWTSKNRNKIDREFKSFTGGDPELSQNNKPRALYNRAFSDAMVRTNDPDASQRAANNEMRSWSKSKYVPPGVTGRAAMEKTKPFADLGHQLDNQVFLFEQSMMDEISATNAKLKEELGPTYFPNQNIRMPDNRPRIPDDITENEMLYKQFNRPTDLDPNLANVPPIMAWRAQQLRPPTDTRSETEFNGENLKIWYDFSHINPKSGKEVYKPYVLDANKLMHYFERPGTEIGIFLYEPQNVQDIAPNVFSDLSSERSKAFKDRVAGKAFEQVATPMDLRALELAGGVAQFKASRKRTKEKKEFIDIAQEATFEEIGKLIGVTRLNSQDKKVVAEFIEKMKRRKEGKDAN